MGKTALNTYLEPGQKDRLERIAKRKGVSQAAVVREAIDEYVARHDTDAAPVDPAKAWEALLGGVYDGDGTANDHDDIYK
jgi:predicted transcriptional regulator